MYEKCVCLHTIAAHLGATWNGRGGTSEFVRAQCWCWCDILYISAFANIPSNLHPPWPNNLHLYAPLLWNAKSPRAFVRPSRPRDVRTSYELSGDGKKLRWALTKGGARGVYSTYLRAHTSLRSPFRTPKAPGARAQSLCRMNTHTTMSANYVPVAAPEAVEVHIQMTRTAYWWEAGPVDT